MKHCRVLLAALVVSLIATPLMVAQFQLPSLGGKTAQSGVLGSGLNDVQIGSGLKDALSVGTQKAVKLVDHPGGYLNNPAIKIPLPKSLQMVETIVRGAGQGPKIDDFVASMNHAAESAAPEAAPIFADAVKSMTIDDARKLLNGGDTSITDYFKAKTSTQLATAFRPHVEAAMKTNGVMEQYQALAGRMPKMSFLGGGGGSNFDIHTYVVNKALDGLFYMLGQQEKEIRTNPAARSTALLQKVFGR